MSQQNDYRILNIGCGDSFYGTHRIDMYQTEATTDVADVENGLPYPDNFFDEIYTKSVLEHIRNIGTFADDCHRVLKKGGKIWIRTDFAGYLPFHLLRSHEHNRELSRHYEAGSFGHNQNDDSHYHFFVESHLDRLFNKFQNRRFTYFYGGRNWCLNIIARLLPMKMGAFHIEMSAEK